MDETENINREIKRANQGLARRDSSRGGFACFMRRVRTPLLMVVGIFVTAFVAIPVAFNGISISGIVEAVEVSAPEKSGEPAPAAPTAPHESPTLEAIVPLESEESAIDQDPEQTPVGVEYATLAFGDTSPEVVRIQQRLMELWYMESDEPTEYFGPATEAAVARFQRSHYMKETGVADGALQSLLFSDKAKEYVIEKGYEGEDVLSLQMRLDELGYYSEKRNGYFGAATASALSAFQTENGMEAHGSADHDTRDLIYSPKAKSAAGTSPTPSPTQPRTPRPSNTPKPSDTPKPSNTPTPTPRPTQSESPRTAGPSATPYGGWGPGPEFTYYIDPVESETPEPTESFPWEPQTPEPEENTPTPGGGTEPVGSGVEGFIALAKQQIGKPYKYSTEGPDTFDCSGLVYYCLRNVGVSTGRYSAAGFAEVASWTTVYGKENMKRGDLIFYKSEGSSTDHITHVAIWLGNGQLLHASSGAGKICITDWGGWSDRNFVVAKRVF